jgi:cell filamentation protein
LKRLLASAGLSLRRAARVIGIAEFVSDLNAVHPFRERNGRSQLAFLHLLALRAGHPLEIERINPVEFLAAIIRSFAGEIEPLCEQLTSLHA